MKRALKTRQTHRHKRISTVIILACGIQRGMTNAALAADDLRCSSYPLDLTGPVSVVSVTGETATARDCHPQARSCHGDFVQSISQGEIGVVRRALPGWLCADFYGLGQTDGWMRVDDTKPAGMQSVPPKLSDWHGTWMRYDDKIRITAYRGRLWVYGNAYYPDRKIGNGLGGFEKIVRPNGDYLHFVEQEDYPEEYACQVQMKLVTPYLVVKDNGKCGGLNVTFSGLYTRVSRDVQR